MTASIQTIKIKRNKRDKAPLEFSYDFGTDLSEAETLFGKDAVFACFLSTAREQLTAYVKRLLAKKKDAPTPEMIQAMLTTQEWTPRHKRGKSLVDKATAIVDAMSDAERAELLKKLQPPSGATGG